MITRNKLIALVLGWAISVVLLSCIAFTAGYWIAVQLQGPKLTARTYYESLDLATPEGAVREFCTAFQRRDYATVYLVLAPRAQMRLQQHFNLLEYSHLIRGELREEVLGEICVFSEGLDQCDYDGDMTYLFDDLMLAAEKHSAFLADLRGKETITGTRPATTSGGDDAVDVTAMVEGIAGEVVFRTVQVPTSGRWRVLQVILPGGDEEMIPWATPGIE